MTDLTVKNFVVKMSPSIAINRNCVKVIMFPAPGSSLKLKYTLYDLYDQRSTQVWINKKFQHKIIKLYNYISLPIIFSISFGCSKELSHETVLFSTHIQGWKILKISALSYITICIGKFNNLQWKQSKFLLVLLHMTLAVVFRRVDFSSPVKIYMFWLRNKKIIFLLRTLNLRSGSRYNANFLSVKLKSFSYPSVHMFWVLKKTVLMSTHRFR